MAGKDVFNELDWAALVDDDTNSDGKLKPVVSPSVVDGLIGAVQEADPTSGQAPQLGDRPAEELVKTVVPPAPEINKATVPAPGTISTPRPGAPKDSDKTQPALALELEKLRADAAREHPEGILAATNALVTDAARSGLSGLQKGEPPKIAADEGSGRRPISKVDAPTVDAADADDAEQIDIVRDMVEESIKKYALAFDINLSPKLGVIRNVRFKSKRLDELEVQYVSAMVIRKLTEILNGFDDATPPLFAILISNVNVDPGVLRTNNIFREIVNSMANLPIPQDTKYGEMLAKVLMMVPPISRDDR